MAGGGIGALSLEKQAGEPVSSREEHKNNQRDDERNSADHREHRRAFAVHPAALRSPAPALCALRGSPRTSPTRYTDPVTSTAAPLASAHSRAARSARSGRGSHTTSAKPSWRACD